MLLLLVTFLIAPTKPGCEQYLTKSFVNHCGVPVPPKTSEVPVTYTQHQHMLRCRLLL